MLLATQFLIDFRKIKNILINQNDDLMDNLTLMKSKRRCVLDNKQAQNISNLFAQGVCIGVMFNGVDKTTGVGAMTGCVVSRNLENFTFK